MLVQHELHSSLDKKELLQILQAVKKGDFSVRMPIDYDGMDGKIADTINSIIEINEHIAKEFQKISRMVGKEGKTTQRVPLNNFQGNWADCIDSVNSLVADLVQPTNEMARVIGAVAKGDLSQTMALEIDGKSLQGEFFRSAKLVNGMVTQLSSFASEVTRVAREVGTEGNLGGQAEVKGVSGTWKDLTENVNSMASNLTAQVRNIADVTTAVANGDLTKKITVDVKGEILQLKNTINTMVDQLNAFASEVTRVAREVGTEGKLGGQAEVRGVGGTWKDLTDNVNSMASNLTAQVRNIADVTTAVANGDLTKKITVDVKGEIQQLKNTINTMVDQLNAFASEVTRVAREVGTEGKLGGQAEVKGVSGTWKDLTDNVNSMASNLTSQVRNIADVTTAVANGDLTKKITVDVKGEIQQLKNTINTMVDQLNAFASEVTRVAREVGTEGKLGGQAEVKGVSGTWKDLTDNVNSMASNLTAQVRNIADVTTAVANGDLTKKITVDVQGEIQQLKNTINTMVDQLNAFASEVTRVAREVGTAGKLGGQADVKGVGGTWKDLTYNVNSMASNLTAQVRSIAKIVTAVSIGDLKRKLVLEAKGEIAELAETINGMIDTLSVFADQVTTVAREVGIEGKLGGQAHVPGAAGRWRDLTDNVNQLAGNLTTQVRAIADVATAVTQGDLTRSIAVQAAGEVASLKDNINEMIRNLKDTTRKNNEQDWLKTNLAKFSRMLQGQRDLLSVGKQILSELSPLVSAQHSIIYVVNNFKDNIKIKPLASYAYKELNTISNSFSTGEGLIGQCVIEKKPILLTDVPADYIKISSGLGEQKPANIIILPVIFESEVKAVIELASFNQFTSVHLNFLEQLMESIGIVLNTITATMRTEDLLKQSQSLTEELTKTNTRLELQAKDLQQSEELLKKQQRDLQNANEILEERAEQLALQNAAVEQKNQEVETAKKLLEEKADQLTQTSRFKSEFLANMSHELRTPLNSLLILAKILSENDEMNLTQKQLEYAQVIYSSGADLLDLINDILDLAKIESGTETVDVTNILFNDIRDFVNRTFNQVAESKSLGFEMDLDEKLPPAISTDGKRLQQVLKNLLSNAFKFTETGKVSFAVKLYKNNNRFFHQESLRHATQIIAFIVSDTGIGIPEDKHHTIFEAFKQADGTTSRKYGGTGLGLSISRKIANMLGGQILLESKVNKGSTFTLCLPLQYSLSRQSSTPAFYHLSPTHAEKSELATCSTVEIQQNDFLYMTDFVVSENTAPDNTYFIDQPNFIAAKKDESNLKFLFILECDSIPSISSDVAREFGFKIIIIDKPQRIISLTRELNPAAILLDMNLSDSTSWVVLDRLKLDFSTYHIPIQIISETENFPHWIKTSPLALLKKPIHQEELRNMFIRFNKYIEQAEKNVLLIQFNNLIELQIIELFVQNDIRIQSASSIEDAITMMKETHFDTLVFDFDIENDVALMLLEQIKQQKQLQLRPIIVFMPTKLTLEVEEELNKLSQVINLQVVYTIPKLFIKIIVSLHYNFAQLTKEQQNMMEVARRDNSDLINKKVLIVDDDIRNIFALSTALERYKMTVLFAENGKAGIELLKQHSDIQIILMDIMMPEMDGLETISHIRNLEEFRKLPIVALTAKAMQDDRERCLAVGATDYLTKPVDTDLLLSTVRVWLRS